MFGFYALSILYNFFYFFAVVEIIFLYLCITYKTNGIKTIATTLFTGLILILIGIERVPNDINNYKKQLVISKHFEGLCQNAFEKIYTREENVNGLLIKAGPKNSLDTNFFHRGDLDHRTFIAPANGRWFNSIGYYRNDNEVEFYTLEGLYMPIKKEISIALKDKFKYELAWKTMSSQEEENNQIYGSHSIIRNIETNQIIAEKKQFIRLSQEDYTQKIIRYCPESGSKSSDGTQPDSYAFVAKALSPAPYAPSVAIKVFDLNLPPPSQKIKECKVNQILVGANIKPEDLYLDTDLSTDWPSMIIKSKVGQQQIICQHFFTSAADPAPLAPLSKFSRELGAHDDIVNIRFFNGPKFNWNEFIKKADKTDSFKKLIQNKNQH